MQINFKKFFYTFLTAVFIVAGFPLSGYAGNFHDSNSRISIDKSHRGNKGGKENKPYKEGELIIKYRRHASQDSHAQLHAA